jgi:hypothetical protein
MEPTAKGRTSAKGDRRRKAVARLASDFGTRREAVGRVRGDPRNHAVLAFRATPHPPHFVGPLPLPRRERAMIGARHRSTFVSRVHCGDLLFSEHRFAQ